MATEALLLLDAAAARLTLTLDTGGALLTGVPVYGERPRRCAARHAAGRHAHARRASSRCRATGTRRSQAAASSRRDASATPSRPSCSMTFICRRPSRRRRCRPTRRRRRPPTDPEAIIHAVYEPATSTSRRTTAAASSPRRAARRSTSSTRTSGATSARPAARINPRTRRRCGVPPGRRRRRRLRHHPRLGQPDRLAAMHLEGRRRPELWYYPIGQRHRADGAPSRHRFLNEQRGCCAVWTVQPADERIMDCELDSPVVVTAPGVVFERVRFKSRDPQHTLLTTGERTQVHDCDFLGTIWSARVGASRRTAPASSSRPVAFAIFITPQDIDPRGLWQGVRVRERAVPPEHLRRAALGTRKSASTRRSGRPRRPGRQTGSPGGLRPTSSRSPSIRTRRSPSMGRSSR